MWGKISAGIVLYNPNIELLKQNISAIYKKIKLLILVDNGSENIDKVSSILPDNSILIRNSKNKGIATALNQICEYSFKNGFEWTLTLDQDSVTPDNLIEEFIKNMSFNCVGMLAPVICDRNRGDILENIDTNKYKEIKECITSGSMINLEVWKEIGEFDEALFIDGVDFDICYRIIQNGYKILQINNVFLSHEIGRMEKHRFLCIPFYVKNHSAFRKYYIARNIIYVAKKRKSRRLMLKAVLQEIKLLGIVALYEEDKLRKFKRISIGIYDGIKGKVGE